jgi:hypothetical protein
MPSVGFEPTISAFERAKAVHALDRVVSLIGPLHEILRTNSYMHNSVSGWKLCKLHCGLRVFCRLLQMFRSYLRHASSGLTIKTTSSCEIWVITYKNT